MNKWLRRLLKFVGAVVLLYAIFLVFISTALFFSFPTSETLANWYLGEVVNGSTQELDTDFLRCHPAFFIPDRNLYGGAETRKVQVEETPGTGSSDTLRFLTLTFEYRLPDSAEWQSGRIDTLMTDFTLLQPRKLSCSD